MGLPRGGDTDNLPALEQQELLGAGAVSALLGDEPNGHADSAALTDLLAKSPPGTPQVQGAEFTVSWQAGGYDTAGRFMGGTETMHLVAHNRRLFAGTGVLNDVPREDPRIGAQVLRLDRPTGSWQLDKHFDEILPEGQARYVRIEALQSMTFTTDDKGTPLPAPVSLLLASPSDRLGQLAVYTRDDRDGSWTGTVLGTAQGLSFIRSFGLHRDTVTGVDRVFAGANTIGTFSGVYDPTVPGRIRWGQAPELVHTGRAMAYTDVNGALHMASKPELHRRRDGPEPSWERVLQYPEQPSLSAGLRALTPVPSLLGQGQDILASLEGPSAAIKRIIPGLDYLEVTELELTEFLRAQWNGLTFDYATAAYNSMLEVVDPRTGQTVHVLGLLAYPPVGPLSRSSFYLIRHEDFRYELREIRPLPHPTIPNPFLFATRAMVASPFAKEKGQVVYFGGYDVQLPIIPAHNTAWIYKATVAALLD